MNAPDPEIVWALSSLSEIRHHLHHNPELSGQEVETANLVGNFLEHLGLDVRRHVGGHGVAATLRGARPGKTLALRADMDALPIQEASTAPYRSQISGVMHACGHDGHTTILLGTASEMTARRQTLSGSIRFLFQPAEETGQGAKRMIAEGAIDGVDAIVALHAWPPLPVGQIGIRERAMTASADTVEIVVTGRGGHGAYPHLAVDPVVAAAHVIVALQTIASRVVDPAEPVVVSITQVQAGTAPNIIPNEVRLAGTLRAHSHAVRSALPAQIERLCEGVCSAFRCRCEVHILDGNPPVINAPEIVEMLSESAGAVLGRENIVTLTNASMGAEDFAEYAARIPGAFFRLGIGSPNPLHSPSFDFNDDALNVGVKALAAFAARYLDGST